MTPIEKLNAAAARLIQEAESTRDQQQIRMKEIATTIRAATAAIRALLEAAPTKPRHAKFRLVVGDEAYCNGDDA